MKNLARNAVSRLHVVAAGVPVGQHGHILSLEDSLLVKKLAASLKVKDGWELTSITGGLFAAYSAGDKLQIFENKNDFEPD